jgi:hypothetical protein
VVALHECCAVPTDGEVDEPAATRVLFDVGGEVICNVPVDAWQRGATPCCVSK